MGCVGNLIWLNKSVNGRPIFVRFDLMITCQLDSKTKQLGHRRKRFLHAAQPIFGPWYGFSPRMSLLRLPGLGRPILAANAFELLLMRLGQGLVSRCRARHFCRVDHTSHPSSPSSGMAISTKIFLITSLFSVGCDFLSRHSPVLV